MLKSAPQGADFCCYNKLMDTNKLAILGGTVVVALIVLALAIKSKKSNKVTGVQDVGPDGIAKYTESGLTTQGTVFEAQVQLLSKEEGGRQTPFTSGYRPSFRFGENEVTGIVQLENMQKVAQPGESIYFLAMLDGKIALNEGDSFEVKEGSRTIGSGAVGKVLFN